MKTAYENDELWKLLGRARPPTVSPFFARNVVREVRQFRQEQPGFFSMLRRHWRLSAATAALAGVVTALAFQVVGNDSHQRQMDSLMAITQQVSDSPDFYVINDLDDLLASEEISVWLDSSVH